MCARVQWGGRFPLSVNIQEFTSKIIFKSLWLLAFCDARLFDILILLDQLISKSLRLFALYGARLLAILSARLLDILILIELIIFIQNNLSCRFHSQQFD